MISRWPVGALASQVVRVELNPVGVSDADRRYILSLCDNPDVTLIIKGLTANLTPTLWTWEYLLVSVATLQPGSCDVQTRFANPKSLF